MDSSSTPKIHIITLGCKVNQCDAEELARALTAQGLSVTLGFEDDVTSPTIDDRPLTIGSVCIVNTCTVTTTADAKARKLIRKLAKEHPQARIIVTGCYAERDRAQLENMPEFCAVIQKSHVGDFTGSVIKAACGGGWNPATLLRSDASSLRSTSRPTKHQNTPELECRSQHRVRAFVKIQDGCNHGCAYCIVHTLRGPMFSKPIAEVMREIEHLSASGMKEIVLCGIHLGAYGIDMQDGTNLAALLHALRAVPLPRLRLSSIEPMDISKELIAEFSDHPTLCHHLHLPLQSGDDGILAAMARGYILDDYRRRVEQVRKAWPDLSLTTDIMVGFPGESDAAFENTLAAGREFDFSRVHVFRFSPRPGTPAAIMNHQVPEKIKRKRSEALMAEADTLFQQRARKLLGEVVEVLFEQKNPASGRWDGLTRHYIRVETKSDRPLAGELALVKISAAEKNILLGGLLD